jgi:AbrB family looped-hinge helix DNA binding protein
MNGIEDQTMHHCKGSLEDLFVGTVTVGERGQIVIPAEARHALGISAGDKLLIMRHPTMSGLMVLKFDGFREFVDEMQQSIRMVEERLSKEETA